MPTDAFGAFGSPLIVWLGPRKYTFPAGRDVTVGRGNDVDIRLDGGSTAGAPSQLTLLRDFRQRLNNLLIPIGGHWIFRAL